MPSERSSGDDEHTECAVCGYEPDPDRVPPHYVLSLSDEDSDGELVQSYPFGGSLSVPFACSDECWLDAQDETELIADGGESPGDAVYHVVCHACPYEDVVEDDRVLAAASEIAHRKRTQHRVEYAEIGPTR